MSQIAYVNGAFVAEQDAQISIFDRGFLFGDGVYEVVPVVAKRLINIDAHMQRLARSMGEIRLQPPMPISDIPATLAQVAARNDIGEGRVYMQITRGPADRDFAFPNNPQPSMIAFGRKASLLESDQVKNGIKVQTLPETRWARRDIKTIMLLPSSLTKQQALDDGYDDAWFVEDGVITEGTSNNAYIITNGTVQTRPLSNDILGGCTRRALLQLAKDTGITIIEESFTVEQAYAADEAFITSASALVTPVIQIDQTVIADGKPGPVARRLQQILIDFANSGV